MFRWGEYLKEEKDIEIINPSEIDIKSIYKVLKKIDDINKIDINNYPYYGSMESDGRKKISVSLEIKENGKIREVLEKIIEELSGYDIEIESISDSEIKNDKYYSGKRISFKLFKKFAAEKLIQHVKDFAQAAPLPNPGEDYEMSVPTLKVIKVGGGMK